MHKVKLLKNKLDFEDSPPVISFTLFNKYGVISAPVILFFL